MSGNRLTHEQFRVQVCELAQLLGWAVQWHWRSYHSPAGFPDLFMVRDKSIIAIELKARDKRGRLDDLTPEQFEWLLLLQETGKVNSYVLTTDDPLEDIAEILKR